MRSFTPSNFQYSIDSLSFSIWSLWHHFFDDEKARFNNNTLRNHEDHPIQGRPALFESAMSGGWGVRFFVCFTCKLLSSSQNCDRICGFAHALFCAFVTFSCANRQKQNTICYARAGAAIAFVLWHFLSLFYKFNFFFNGKQNKQKKKQRKL